MGRGRGSSGRGGGSVRGLRSERCIGIYAVIEQHATSVKDKFKSGIYKALGNSMFTYKEKNSADDMRTTWEKSV